MSNLGRKLVTVVGSEDGNIKSQLARSLIDPLGVYIALLCVQLPPWEAILTCGLSCVQAGIAVKPGIQLRALALAGASVWAAPPWYSIVFVSVDSIRVMRIRRSVFYAEILLATICTGVIAILCSMEGDWLSTFVGVFTTALGVWSLPTRGMLTSSIKLTQRRVMVVPLALMTWSLGSPYSANVHYAGFLLVLLHTWSRDASLLLPSVQPATI